MTRRNLFATLLAAPLAWLTGKSLQPRGQWGGGMSQEIFYKGKPVVWDPVITPNTEYDWRTMSVPITITPITDGRTDHLVRLHEAWCATAERNLQEFFDKKLFSS
jgi:hypothetical protein